MKTINSEIVKLKTDLGQTTMRLEFAKIDLEVSRRAYYRMKSAKNRILFCAYFVTTAFVINSVLLWLN